MYIELICNDCNNKFFCEFEEKKISSVRCPKCGMHPSAQDESVIIDFTEKFYSFTNRLKSIQVQGIFSGVKDKCILPDLESLNSLYNNGSDEIKSVLASMLDTFYLTVNRDCYYNNLDKLKEKCQKLREIFFAHVEQGHREMEERFGISEEDKPHD